MKLADDLRELSKMPPLCVLQHLPFVTLNIHLQKKVCVRVAPIAIEQSPYGFPVFIASADNLPLKKLRFG